MGRILFKILAVVELATALGLYEIGRETGVNQAKVRLSTAFNTMTETSKNQLYERAMEVVNNRNLSLPEKIAYSTAYHHGIININLLNYAFQTDALDLARKEITAENGSLERFTEFEEKSKSGYGLEEKK